MSIRLASPPHAMPARMARACVRAACPVAANDNGEPASPHAIHAALRHFARHGIAAAAHARQQAQNAADKGDHETCEWWLDICRALDRRMASKLTGPACAG